MLGGLCVGVGRVYNKSNNALLSAGILFVAAGEMDEMCTLLATLTTRSNHAWAGVSNRERQLDRPPVVPQCASSVVQSKR